MTDQHQPTSKHQPTTKHQPVMLKTALDELEVRENYWYLDGTLGMGGHTEEIINRGGKVIAFEWDKESYNITTKRLQAYIEEGKLITIHDNFRYLSEKLETLNQEIVDHIRGAIFDFGTSVPQLTSNEKGFSFQGDGPLDMRMFPERQNVTAADLLVFMTEKQLTQVLLVFGGENSAKKIAKRIKSNPEPITTTKQLVALLEKVVARHGRLHPATKTFQALRIAVNSELEHLEVVLPQALEALLPGGKLVTISFHEGEDRIVKQTFKGWEVQNLGENVYKKPLIPDEDEVRANPRSRSAKLRVFKKL